MFLVRSGAIEGFEHLVARRGGNPLALLQEVGLPQSQLRNPNTYVSYSQMAELLERAAEACRDDLFGLRLSRQQNATVLGDLALTLAQHPTLGEALADINKYLYLHARGARIDPVPQGDELCLELRIEISSPRGLFQLIQVSVGQLANFIAELLALEAPAFPILLRQEPPPGDSHDLPRQLLRRIAFAAPMDGIRIPRRWLQSRPRYDAEALRRHFQDHIRQLQQRYPDNLQDQIRDIMGQMLPSGECRIERVAATLEMHPRVLQKRLRQQGTGYNDLLRRTRMEIAEQHLRYRSMGITELALNLGYADVSVFSRHFKLWTGLSPRAWQKAHA